MEFDSVLRAMHDEMKQNAWGGLLLWAALLAAWLLWFTCAHVSVYVPAQTVQIEGEQLMQLVSEVSGQVLENHLIPGHLVHAGDVLVQLNATAAQHALDEVQVLMDSLTAEVAAVEAEIRQEQLGMEEERSAMGRAAEEAQAQAEVERLAAEQAGYDATDGEKLYAKKLLPIADIARLRNAQEAKKGAYQAAQSNVELVKQQGRVRLSTHLQAVQTLRRTEVGLRSRRAEAQANFATLKVQVALHTVQAAQDGTVMGATQLRPGSYVHAGDRLGSIAPVGGLRAVATCAALEAVGRVEAGQEAMLRLAALPWLRFGAVRATVTYAEAEPLNDSVRVELALVPTEAQRPLLRHGMRGDLEIAVQSLTPYELMLQRVGAASVTRAETPP